MNKNEERQKLLDDYARIIVATEKGCPFCGEIGSTRLEDGIYVVCTKCGEIVEEYQFGDRID